jgi:dGTPase
MAEGFSRDSELAEKYGAFETIATLDPDAVEASGLAHDLGHPPFAHLAEDVLRERAQEYDGFDANAQSFRIVNFLAAGTLRENGFRGMNLTRRTLNGMLKYPWSRGTGPPEREKFGVYQTEADRFDFARSLSPIGVAGRTRAEREQRSVEAELVDWADDVTYAVHDLEDFYRAGIMRVDRLVGRSEETARFVSTFWDEQGNPTGRLTGCSRSALEEAVEELTRELALFREPYDGSLVMRSTLRIVTSRLVGRYMRSIEPRDPTTLTPESPELVTIKEKDRAEVTVLKELLWFYVISDERLGLVQAAQREIITTLFFRFLRASESTKGWTAFPPQFREELLGPGDSRDVQAERLRARVVLDLVSSLTEEEAIENYEVWTGARRGLSGLLARSRSISDLAELGPRS